MRYFSYFTMLSNILVALAMTLPWLASDSKLGSFFLGPAVRTAILAYIIIVAVIYHICRQAVEPARLGIPFADTIEHVVTPALLRRRLADVRAERHAEIQVGLHVAAFPWPTPCSA